VVVFTSIAEDDEEMFGASLGKADDPSSCFVGARRIGDKDGFRVVEDFGRFAEGDPVLLEVALRFFFVPLIVPHALLAYLAVGSFDLSH